MNKGEVLKYIGKGFIGFDKNDTEMIYLNHVDTHCLNVKYKNFSLWVYDHEVVGDFNHSDEI